ncbi:CI-B8 domain-containing protein [Triangularia setosa]|uniref:CI-B8 domain-containing protein n=1 Tax=Triangularia setosa TaxID=2587417 RepID=A0AAN7ACV1_9PEZI|nr:CI-B8 domain-containing protein [Podospora setosa]
MVGVIRRLHKLKALLDIKCGSGAAIFPSDVTRIHLEFAYGLAGHLGPRKFWKTNLPRLKFWNPAIPMVINRTRDAAGPAILSVYFREPGSTLQELQTPSSSFHGFAKAPQPAEGERVLTIDMKNLASEKILEELLTKSGAVPVRPSPQDEADMAELRGLEQTGEIDRDRVKRKTDAEKREKRLIAQAQSEAAAIRAAL